MNIPKHRLVELKKISDGRGNLTCVEAERQIPFKIKRLYFIYDVPHNQIRGNHAHKKLHQFIIAIKGSFNITLDDGINKRQKYRLNKPNIGLYIPPMVWREFNKFSADAVCLCIVSKFYTDNDYIRNYEDFIKIIKKYVKAGKIS